MSSVLPLFFSHGFFQQQSSSHTVEPREKLTHHQNIEGIWLSYKYVPLSQKYKSKRIQGMKDPSQSLRKWPCRFTRPEPNCEGQIKPLNVFSSWVQTHKNGETFIVGYIVIHITILNHNDIITSSPHFMIKSPYNITKQIQQRHQLTQQNLKKIKTENHNITLESIRQTM